MSAEDNMFWKLCSSSNQVLCGIMFSEASVCNTNPTSDCEKKNPINLNIFCN